MINEKGKLVTVWLLETTYTSGIKEVNGVFETEEKALKDAEFIKSRNGIIEDDKYIIESQKVTEYFVL